VWLANTCTTALILHENVLEFKYTLTLKNFFTQRDKDGFSENSLLLLFPLRLLCETFPLLRKVIYLLKF